MLSKVLEKSTCADCRFCCSFRRCSLWETPLFPMDVVDKLTGDEHDFTVRDVNGESCGQMNLGKCYRTDDSEEEAACYFLDSSRGCVLPNEDKPFDCKIWPLRIMRKDDRLVIALTPTCPAINKVGEETMRQLAEDGLGETIYEYAAKHPFIIKEYKEGFPILMEFAK